MFSLKQHGTTPRTEVIAGFTTFLTMAYIMVVNPMILGAAGVPFDVSFFATVIAALIGSILMGLGANLPIAIAPGMGINAYFAFSVVNADKGIDYRVALAAVFVAGFIFVLLSFTSLRTKLIEVIPNNLKFSITTGIGLFIAFLGLRLSGIIVSHPENLVGLGNLHDHTVILTLVGLMISIILIVLDVKGAIFIGMLATAIISIFTGDLSFKEGFFSLPSLPSEFPVINPVTAFKQVFEYSLYPVVFSFLLVTLFDTTGTLVGVTSQAGLIKDGKIPNAGRAMFADSIATTIGSLLGTTPTTAYIESSAGVAVGGRTGLTSVTVALLFGASLFFAPLVSAISAIPAITAPALIIVGSFMLADVTKINFKSFDEAFPAFLIILSMPLTSSISTGIALGFITYPVLKVVKGQWRAVHPLLYIFGVLFLIQLVFMPH